MTPKRPCPPRVSRRPSPEEWGPDELLTLEEAASLFWPDGPLGSASLKLAYKQGLLAVAVIARKFLTSRRAIEDMARREVRLVEPGSAPEPPPGDGPSAERRAHVVGIARRHLEAARKA